MPAPFSPSGPPDTLASQTDLEAWRNLFRARKSWALELAERCSLMSEAAQRRLGETRVIERAVEVAISNLKTHVASLEQKGADAQAWSQAINKEQEPAVIGWEDTVARLTKIPVKESVLRSRLFQGNRFQSVADRNRYNLEPTENQSLGDLVETQSIARAAKIAWETLQQLEGRTTGVDDAVQRVITSSDGLFKTVNSWISHSMGTVEDPSTLMEDIEIVAKKVSSDYEQVLGHTDFPKSISQASKKALVHTRDYLPSLRDNAIRLSQLQRQVTEHRNTSAVTAVQYLQKISAVESTLANANHQLSSLEVSSKGLAAFAMLSNMIRLPYLYGSVLLELIRRREWNEKVRADSATLAEELAALTEEEEGRRKKWQRSVSEAIIADSAEEKAVSVEVNLQGDEQAWPHLERRDVYDYLNALRKLDGMGDIIKELSQLVSDLDRPTRQQAKHARAFKNSSVHEAALGRSSLLLRGDDELVRSLRDEKSKLEEKLKGSQSRIRKLEDIVHRQGDMSRNAAGNVFQPPDTFKVEVQSTQPSNPQPFVVPVRPRDALSRHSSVSSRRFSATHGGDEKALLQRVIALEGELAAERELIADLQKETAARREAENAIKGQMEEANSTKKDLMENLEAQQREFSDERKLLEDDVRKLRARHEEVEDELDRVIGSKENERIESDERVRALEAKLEAVQRETVKDIERMRDDLHTERTSTKEHQKKANEGGEQIQRTMAERLALESVVRSLEKQLHQKAERQTEQQKGLQAIHEHLSSSQNAPADFENLIKAIQTLTERSANHLHDIKNALEMARADNETLQNQVDRSRSEYTALQDKLGTEEMESFALRETLAGERGRVSSLEEELKDNRSQLKTLRANFADGETGSQALRERVAEEERKVTELSSKLAATEAEMKVVEGELQARQDELRAVNIASRSDAARLQTRTVRARDLSQRLYALTDRMTRLLETLGFMVSHQNGTMNLQRVSKAMIASASEHGLQSFHEGRPSLSPSAGRNVEGSGELHSIRWTDDSDPDKESENYVAYLSVVENFDADVFADAMVKRLKEIEHVARKWQKEARSYRDRAHRLQLEAHQKIAFRSFREGDLALFLPTRNQATRPWAAFNVGAPHFFLREQDSHKLRTRDWLLARITKVEERVVDLSRTINGGQSSITGDGRSIGESSDGGAPMDDENPFELSDGLRWYLLDAAEEKPGAPSTPGLGKSTVASAIVDAKGSVRLKKSAFSSGATKTLSKSLDSRRSSSNSKKDGAAATTTTTTAINPSSPTGITTPADGSRASTSAGLAPQESNHQQPIATAAAAKTNQDTAADAISSTIDGPPPPPSPPADHTTDIKQEVRHDLLWGP